MCDSKCSEDGSQFAKSAFSVVGVSLVEVCQKP